MQEHEYPSFGRCVFCLQTFAQEDLTDEHIIPYSLNGRLVIRKGSCVPCAQRSNQEYENPTLQSALLAARSIMELNRRKKKDIKRMPKLWPGDHAARTSMKGIDSIEVDVSQYPPLMFLLVLEPAGKLIGVPRGDKFTAKLRIWIYNFGTNTSTVNNVTMRQLFRHQEFALTVTKIAYCYAVAELGLDGFDGTEIRDLLMGRRDDVYNFFGGSVDGDCLLRRDFHGLMLRERKWFRTVVFHLFSSLRAPPYEVVIGPA
jgi:HNH endonuclease